MTLIEQYITQNNFGKTLGMDFKIIEPGLVHYFLSIKEEHLATPRAAHGGVISGLMDGLLGVTALSVSAKDNHIVSTVEFKINFFAAAFVGDKLQGIGKIEHQGKRLIVTSAEIICPERNNIVIAKALGTFNTYPAEKAGYLV
ncbi:MAG: PaaI family thioesterase [Bacteroidetes bacterium]|jgi:acyl-CoA thioesterase|nr:PaaI family thioesterase [Bacteroidota bacterium]MDF2453081.1 PaaI family thioesterase [Bacteroidota bacterium]